MGNQAALGRHEQFEVDGARGGAQQVRQDRFEHAGCRVDLGGHEFAVCNYSGFGLAVVGASAIEHDEVVEVPLLSRDVEVARLRLRRVRVERLGDGRYKTAFAIVGEPLSLTRLDAIARAQGAVEEHARSLEETAAVPARFRAEVYEIREALEALEARINALTAGATGRSRDEALEVELA